jgi:arylsulfatase A-like enzyme
MIKNSFESNEIVSHIDLLPTILDLINSLDNNESDGVSWKNHLLSNIKLEERPIFWHYPHYGNQGGTPCSCIRLGNYKLIEFFENNRIELYNIDYDIGETNNLSDKLKDKSEMLYRLLKDWQQNTKAKFPEINPNTEVF